MGNYSELKTAISNAVKANGNGEITGAVLQSTLLNIVNTIGANATFAGVATPSTAPGTPDQNVFYLAAEHGVYTNFISGLELQEGLHILYSYAGGWAHKNLGTSGLTLETDDLADLSMSDEKGNVLVRFRNGHIQTKNFNSELLDVNPAGSAAVVNNEVYLRIDDKRILSSYNLSTDTTIDVYKKHSDHVRYRMASIESIGSNIFVGVSRSFPYSATDDAEKSIAYWVTYDSDFNMLRSEDFVKPSNIADSDKLRTDFVTLIKKGDVLYIITHFLNTSVSPGIHAFTLWKTTDGLNLSKVGDFKVDAFSDGYSAGCKGLVAEDGSLIMPMYNINGHYGLAYINPDNASVSRVHIDTAHASYKPSEFSIIYGNDGNILCMARREDSSAKKLYGAVFNVKTKQFSLLPDGDIMGLPAITCEESWIGAGRMAFRVASTSYAGDERKNLKLFVSPYFGHDMQEKLLVSEDAGYSDACIHNGELLVLYEKKAFSTAASVHITRIKNT